MTQSKPCVYSISVDYGNEETIGEDSEDSDGKVKKSLNSTESSSWMGAVGMLFGYSNSSQNQESSQLIVQSGQYEGSHIGSYGYLMNQIGTTMCPPDKLSWESLLIARADELILDLVCEQIISLSCGLLDITTVFFLIFSPSFFLSFFTYSHTHTFFCNS